MLNSNSPLLGLPPEIRNQIIRPVLHPRHIYPHQITTFNKRMLKKGTSPAKVTLESTSSNSGPGVLATCRQLYTEWHEFYYSSNVFHIPTSSIMIMQPNHRALIQHVGLRLSLSDVISSKTEEVEALAEAVAKASEAIMNSEVKECTVFPLCCAAVLLGEWLSNISSIQESFSGLKSVCIKIRTQVEPHRLLRLVTAAKDIHSLRTGYRFKFLNFHSGSVHLYENQELIRLKRKWQGQYRLNAKVGCFLDFAAHQALNKVIHDIPHRTGTWAKFKDSFDAEFVKKYDDEILTERVLSYWSWGIWQPRIEPITESVESV